MSDVEPGDEPDDDQLPGDEPAATENVGTRSGVRKRIRKAEFAENQSREFWKRVFADPVGAREMWGILQACHAFETKFACGPNGFPQPEATWHALGEQSVGRRLYDSWLLLDRDGVLRMQDEHDPRFKKPKAGRS